MRLEEVLPQVAGEGYEPRELLGKNVVGTDRESMASGRECRAALEMILATYASQLSGSKVALGSLALAAPFIWRSIPGQPCPTISFRSSSLRCR